MSRLVCLAVVAAVVASWLPAAAQGDPTPPPPMFPSPPAYPTPTWTAADLVNMGCYNDNKNVLPTSPQRAFPGNPIWLANRTSLERCVIFVQRRCANCTVLGLFKDYCL